MSEYTSDSPIIRLPAATASQAIAYLHRRPTGEYTGDDIEVIVGLYWRIATAVGIDPVLAVAQMVHETGNLTSWWSQRPRRNPAGIGVTGRARRTPPGPRDGAWAQRGAWWVEGCSFPSWADDAIPAHLGRLLAYAVRDTDATPAQRSLIQRALAVRPLPASYRGSAPTLRGLEGRWAVPGRGYAMRIAMIANLICVV